MTRSYMSRRDQRRLSRLLVAAAAGFALVLSGCGTAQHVASAGDSTATKTPQSTGAQPRQTDTPSPARLSPPKVGRCRLLTAKDIPPSGNATRTRPCRQRHTSVTYFVGKLRPALLGGPRAVVSAFANKRCGHEITAYLGGGVGDRSQTLLTYAYFYPSANQRAANANWFRCDVISGYELQNRLYPLPAKMRGILAHRIPDTVRACYTKPFINNGNKRDPGAWVPCTTRHAQRTIAALRLGGARTKYAGFNRLGITVNAWCKPKAQAYLGFPQTYSWGYNWPDAKEWKRGDRYGRCLAVTSR
jgi:hypothetical protein